MNTPKIFLETQKFTQWWLSVAIFWVFTALNLYANRNSFSVTESIFIIGLVSLVTVLIYSIEMETIIDEQGIRVRFFPFHINYRYFPWRSVKKIYVRTYAPLREYGGWGIRGFLGRGKAYNIRGNQGIQLLLQDNKRLLLGTQKSMEAAETIAYYTNNGFPKFSHL